jgi:hypothetical protein
MADRRSNASPAPTAAEVTAAEYARETNARRLKRAARAERAYLDRLQRSGTKPGHAFAADWSRPR